MGCVGPDIVEAFKRSLSNLDWMDKTSADAAAEKVSSMSPHIWLTVTDHSTGVCY
jgi:predicted metalloendopeptidase